MKGKTNEKKTIINPHIGFFVIFFVIFFGFFLECIGSEPEIGAGFALVSLLPVFIFFISPVAIQFTPKELIIVYNFGKKEVIKWREIKHMYSKGSYISRLEGFPQYEIVYHKKEKTLFFMKGEIPRTRRIKKTIEKYYRGEIY